MSKLAYEVCFEDESSVEEWGRTSIEAVIVAQANRIKKGETYVVTDVKYIGRVSDDKENGK